MRDFGVYLLWEVLRDRYPHFEFTHGHGLGIRRRRREDFPQPVRALFAASASATAVAGDPREPTNVSVVSSEACSSGRTCRQLTRHVRRLEALICELRGEHVVAPDRAAAQSCDRAAKGAAALSVPMQDATSGAARATCDLTSFAFHPTTASGTEFDGREIRLDVDQRRAVEAVEPDHGKRGARRCRTSRTTLMAIGFGRTGERNANVPRRSP